MKKSHSNWFIENAPNIAFWGGNIILALCEIRVFDFAFRVTHDYALAFLAVFSTFIPFSLWEIMWQHKHASPFMQVLSVFGMAVSFLLGLLIGTADYSSAAMLADGKNVSSASWSIGLIIALAGSMGIHGVCLLLYFYVHPRISADRKNEQAKARMERARQNVIEAEAICNMARQKKEAFAELVKEYGEKEALAAIADITGEDDEETNFSIWLKGLGEHFSNVKKNANAFAKDEEGQPRLKK